MCAVAVGSRSGFQESECGREDGVLRRGALSARPVFYITGSSASSADSIGGRGADEPVLCSAGRAVDVAGPGARVWSAVVAAGLLGGALPVPLTPFEGVLQLACGSGVRVESGRVRLELEALDVAALVAWSWEVTGRGVDPVVRVRRALAYALADAARAAGECGQVLVVGDGGGLGAAALAAVASDVARLHVHADVPVLERRARRVTAAGGQGVRVVDASAAWREACAGGRPPWPAACDPWSAATPVLAGTGLDGARLVSGAGLAAMFTAPPPAAGWLRGGWRLLSSAAPPAGLEGEPWWRPWRRHQVRRSGRAGPPAEVHSEAGAGPGHHLLPVAGPAGRTPGEWLAAEVRRIAAPVTSGHAASHLIPQAGGERGERVPGSECVRVVVDLLEQAASRAFFGGPEPEAAPVLIAAHPVVLGTALSLAADGLLGAVYRDGRRVSAPLLRALLPDGWREADVTPAEREKLLSAAFVTTMLGSERQRAKLLSRVRDSPWVATGPLADTLADPDLVLAHAAGLHRLYVAAARHPEALAAPAALDPRQAAAAERAPAEGIRP
ncbi:hypothetical protein [Streptomyces sp. MZ04]|uniref:hypothetical protein n=1 Tax=Streptomyces sp. MZ04 TaxID=2559236 RepID=UPI00107E8AF4|nr:hypothetical protein [Streptomyces sp. MZ04]TGA94384.1 hypothetical protein E2651_35325 [Streptomyces sp. MZ04]